MQLCAALHERQTDARSGRAPRVVRAPEAREYLLELAVGYAFSFVADGHKQTVWFFSHGNRNFTACFSVTNGVVHEVDQHPGKDGSVRAQDAGDRFKAERHFLFFDQREHVFCNLRCHLTDITFVIDRRLTGVHAREQKEMRDERIHVVGAFQHCSDGIVLFLNIFPGKRKFSLRDHAVERRAQLMGGVGSKLHFAPEGLFKTIEHIVERHAEFLKLIALYAVFKRNPRREIFTAGDGLRDGTHLVHRSKSTGRQEIAADQSKNHQRSKNEETVVTHGAAYAVCCIA